MFHFNPKENDYRVKPYIIKIKLTDNNSSPKSSIYYFKIQVNSNSTTENNDEGSFNFTSLRGKE